MRGDSSDEKSFVTVQRVGKLVPPQPQFELVSTTVSAAGEVVAIWARGNDATAFASSTTQAGWATFPDSRSPARAGAVVVVHGSDDRVVCRIEDLPIAHPVAQLLPGDRVLIAGARCHWTESGAEPNAAIYNKEGSRLLEGTLGDGIGHLRTTPAGFVWVGYFDEGIYGNYGWGGPNGPAPIGAPGIVCFTGDLQPSWDFPSHADNPWDAVDDCYALAVDGETVWAYYYSSWPIVRIQDGAVRAWTNEIGGARALAVRSDHVSLVGGYGTDRDRLVTGTLGTDSFEIEAVKRIALPDGSELPAGTVVSGSAGRLHFIRGDDWFALDV